MSILDDAIREHLELKRQHGADETELKKLEDEAFGPPLRQDELEPLAEAPTEFLATPDAAAAETAASEGEGRRRINVADLQEPPPPRPPEAEEPQPDATETAGPPRVNAPPTAPAEDSAQTAPPAEEVQPTIGHEPVSAPAEEPPEAEAPQPEEPPEPPADPGPSTQERHAIAEQPTELFDIESEMGTEDAPATEAASPSDEEIAEVEASDPKLAPVEPATEIHASRAETAEEPAAAEDEEEDDFWSDQRLSDELDQALETPVTDEHEAQPPAAPEPLAPITDEHDDVTDLYEDAETEDRPKDEPEDVLEETPEFLEDAPEDDELWFEQRPPKDFDFDD